MVKKASYLVALMTLLLALPAVAVPQEASFTSLDGTLLKAWVFLPLDHAPRGTVIALHGCGGLYASRGPRPGAPSLLTGSAAVPEAARHRLNARHQAMADLLVAEGYAAVFPDSLTPRGETELCTQKISSRQISQTERRADALAALAWVAVQPWARAEPGPARMALLGWSHGGSAVLSATDAARVDVRSQAPRPLLAVAFYPGCGSALKSGYQPSAPLVLMLGEKDDWTPPGPCIELGKTVGAEVHVYPDSYHDFDNPSGVLRLRSDVPNGLNPGQGVHVGPNPVAREQAYDRLRQVLRQAFR